MTRQTLLHVRRGCEGEELQRVERAVAPAKKICFFTLALVRHVRGALLDTTSDIIICADFSSVPPDHVLRSIRWAVHHRFQPKKYVHAQLLCDLTRGDESRLKRKPGRDARRVSR